METVLRILIADDDTAVRHAFRRLLDAEPYCEVCADAADGQEAVEMARQLRPDLVLLDVHMPVLDGFETARKIRAFLPDAAVLFVTADESQIGTGTKLPLGTHGLIQKDNCHLTLLPAIRKIIEHRKVCRSNLGDKD